MTYWTAPGLHNNSNLSNVLVYAAQLTGADINEIFTSRKNNCTFARALYAHYLKANNAKINTIAEKVQRDRCTALWYLNLQDKDNSFKFLLENFRKSMVF
jgi:hypothetical protein